MQQKKVWIGIGILIVIIGAVIIVRAQKAAHPKLPPADTTLAGPQEPIGKQPYDVKPPLKNKVRVQNGMKIETTKEGTGSEITNGQTAVVSYIGRFENGTIFDASKNHGDGTFPFEVGGGQVIKGWDQGVLGMKVGETRVLTIPGDLAYGPMGVPGVIPPNATLIFEVSLIAIK